MKIPGRGKSSSHRVACTKSHSAFLPTTGLWVWILGDTLMGLGCEISAEGHFRDMESRECVAEVAYSVGYGSNFALILAVSRKAPLKSGMKFH